MMIRLGQLWAERRATLVVALLALGSGGVLGAVRLGSRAPAIPTFELRPGEFIDSLQFRGEVKALKSIAIAAPTEAGDLQVVKIATDGALVEKGDVVVEFDPTKTQQDLAQYRSALKSAQAEIEQARAQARLSGEEDVTAVIKAHYAVEAAKLESSRQEIISKIEGEEARLKLSDAEQKLREAQAKQIADRAANDATIRSKVQGSQKARFDVERAQRSLAQMTIRAPAAGMISLSQVWRPDGQAPFKAGDRAWPGAPIAELPDLSTLRVSARVDETERGRLQLGQAVTIQLDAIPDRQFTGQIAQISTIATADFSAGWPFPRNFDLEIAIDQADTRLKPEMTSQVTVVIDRLSNSLSIPVEASFQRVGRTVAYVLRGARFEERTIEVGRRSGDRILVVRGLAAGERVARKDPTLKE